MAPTRQHFVLRPLELKHLFDFAIRLYRANFAPMFLAMAMVQLPISLAWFYPTLRYVQIAGEMQQAAGTGVQPDWSYFAQYIDFFVLVGGLMLFSAAYQLFVWPLGALTCTRLAARSLVGEPVGFGQALRHARKRYWPTQVALATFFLPIVILSLLVLVPVVGFNAAGNTPGTITFALVGLLLIGVGGVGTALMWFRFFPALDGAVQSAEAPEAEGILGQGLWYLKRAYSLSEGYYIRLLGLYLLMAFAIGFVEQGLTHTTQLLISVGQSVMAGDSAGQAALVALLGPADTMAIGLTLLIATLFALLFPPLLKAYEVVLYFDLRCRKEAFDLMHGLGAARIAP